MPEQPPIDKTTWGAGPWQSEPDRQCWREGDFICLARRPENGHWCGYVAVPPGHPAFEQDEYALNLYVHGGLTWCRNHAPDEAPDGNWWLGFDCAHSGDLVPGSDLPFAKSGEYRTLDYVTAQIADLVMQLKEMKNASHD